MQIVYEGHACFGLLGEKRLIIDPYFTGNSQASKSWQQVETDYILITHGHGDHLGDAVAIAEHTGAPIIAAVELLAHLESHGAKTMDINMGGSLQLGAGVRVKMVPALHGSQIMTSNGPQYAGLAAGYIIEMDGLRLYHAGDTALFGDMEKVIARHRLDVAFLPIGDCYTMGPEDALVATHWLKPRFVIPMHYDTFPVIEKDEEAFAMEINEKTESRCRIMKPGQTWTIER